jgi:Ca2+-transporting ATPase
VPPEPAPAGLSSAEAERRLHALGSNALPEAPPPSLLARGLRQFRSPLVYLLLLAVAFDTATWWLEGARGWPIDATIIGAVLLANAGLALLQEQRSEAALARLRGLAAPRAWVLRDGRLRQVPSQDVVPDDVIRLEAGERVPADGILLEARGFAVDESLLTGESVPVEKSADAALLSGTLAVRGSGLARVTATGARSRMGRLATGVAALGPGSTPLERRLDAFGHRVAGWVIGIAAALLLAGLIAEGASRLDELLVFSVALAVSAVPEGLPAVVTLTLALGVQRMARRNVVVRRLQAVEALGSVSVIATDKTGTLTENRMSVEALDAPDPEEALRAMVLANDAEPDAQAGDPLERGLLAWAAARGLEAGPLRRAWPRVGGRPFDSTWKFMRVDVEHAGRRASYWKGAPEALLARAALSEAERADWSARAEARAGAGFRVLGLARGDDGREEGLHFLGLVSLWDPPRPEVAAALAAARRAGIRTLMVTGDHPGTALAVARRIGLAGDEARAVTGDELDACTPAERAALARTHDVFARVGPEHKLALVEALAAAGEIVAVTGDGVNDAPALKAADVGVAMGQRGSDVAREVADLVLLDDDYASIVHAVREGRGIFDNIQSFVRFLFSTNAAELLLIVAGTLGAWTLGLRDASGALLVPLTAVQILWVNLLTDGVPALALGLDRNVHGMDRPPRPRESPLLDRASLRFVLLAGGLKAALAGALLLGLPWAGSSLEATRTSVFLYTALAQLLFAYPARRVASQPLPNPLLHLAIGASVALQLACVALPGLREVLGLVPLEAAAWGSVGLAVALTWAGAELVLRSGREAGGASGGDSVRTVA